MTVHAQRYSASGEVRRSSGPRAPFTPTRAVRARFTAGLNLIVRNIAADDFGKYAGDGIDDDWQVLYFGENNADAAPEIDADGSGTCSSLSLASIQSMAHVLG